MIINEAKWIRQNNKKFCPLLRNKLLNWCKPIRFVPCFLQKIIKGIIQPFRKVPVIVQLEDGYTEITVNSLATISGFHIKKSLPIINSFSTKINEKGLKKLVECKHVKKIWYDAEVKVVLDLASKTVNSPSLWNNNVTGENITVAILDTGIYNHPDLQGRIIGFKDCINKKKSPYDDNGHGTHVAGDVASNGSKSNNRYRAPAPEANLVGVKVLNRLGHGNLSVVIEGIDWCIKHKNSLGIRIINMWLGSKAIQSYSEDPVCEAVEKAWKSGIIVCVAAGNEGPESQTINSPGIDPMVITVGATDDMNTVSINDDNVANFSSRGPTIDGLDKPDIVAPGTDVISLRSPVSFLDKQSKSSRIGQWYLSLSGTSMATAICCGVIAQILQIHSDMSPDDIKNLIKSKANTLHLNPHIQGEGIIDAEKSIKS